MVRGGKRNRDKTLEKNKLQAFQRPVLCVLVEELLLCNRVAKVGPGSIERLYKLSTRDGTVSPQNQKPYQRRLFPKWNRRTDG